MAVLRQSPGHPRGFQVNEVLVSLREHRWLVRTLLDALDRLAAGESVIDPEIVDALLERRHRLRELDQLTGRERDVLRLMAEGRSNAGIAASLYVTTKSVESYIARIFVKLGLPAEPKDNRRVLAVLGWLRSTDPPRAERPTGSGGAPPDPVQGDARTSRT